MKRMIILIIAAAVIPIGVLKAVPDCEWDDDPVDTSDCECSGGYCHGVGHIEVTWTCPSDGDCPGCGESCYERAARFPTPVIVYAEPDCNIIQWPPPPQGCTYDHECDQESWDTSSIVWDYLGNCDCWDF